MQFRRKLRARIVAGLTWPSSGERRVTWCKSARITQKLCNRKLRGRGRSNKAHPGRGERRSGSGSCSSTFRTRSALRSSRTACRSLWIVWPRMRTYPHFNPSRLLGKVSLVTAGLAECYDSACLQCAENSLPLKVWTAAARARRCRSLRTFFLKLV